MGGLEFFPGHGIILLWIWYVDFPSSGGACSHFAPQAIREQVDYLCFSLLMHLTHALFMCERFCDRNLDSRAPIGTEEKLVSYRTDDCVNRSRNDLLAKPRQP